MYWHDYEKPSWEIRLEDAPEYVIQKTGMTRKELERLLHYLQEEGIIIDFPYKDVYELKLY